MSYIKNKKVVTSRGRIPSKWLVALLVLIIIAVAAVVYVRHSSKSDSGTIPTIDTSASTSNDNKTTSNDDQSASVKTPGASTSQTTAVVAADKLIAPYGTFVSNHNPSLSGKTSPSVEESTCVTNAGVSCHLEFTKDGVTKKLAAQTTGGDGSTSWDWDVKKAGLTTGEWTITAVVTSGNNSKSRQDSIKLTVVQ